MLWILGAIGFFGGGLLFLGVLAKQRAMAKSKQLAALGAIFRDPALRKVRAATIAALVMMGAGAICFFAAVSLRDRERDRECATRCADAGYEDHYFAPSAHVEKRASCWCGKRGDPGVRELYLRD